LIADGWTEHLTIVIRRTPTSVRINVERGHKSVSHDLFANGFFSVAISKTGNSSVTFLSTIGILRGLSHRDFACVPLKPLRSIAAPTSNCTTSAAVRCRPQNNSRCWRAERRNKLMKRLNAVLGLAFSLAMTFALMFSSQAGPSRRHVTTTQQKKYIAHEIHIVDQNGQPAVSAVPSGTGQIFDVAVGVDGFTFTPSTANIQVGDTVRWTWLSNGHSVTSGDPCTADEQFCSPDDTNCDQGVLSNTGAVYEHTFDQAGTYSYFCVAHCALGMTGVVNVVPRATGLLYGSTGGDHAAGGGRLWLFDVTNETATLIGDTGFDRLGGIAFDSNGTLYGVAGGASNPSTLLTIDPSNGMATVIGPISDPDAHVDGLRFNSQGILYGSAFNSSEGAGTLVTIDPSDGNVVSSLTLVGSGDSFCAGIAFDSKDVLYGSRGNGSREEDLDVIDQITGVLTPIGPMEVVISDIVFGPNGILFASNPNGVLYRIDPVTGTKTLLFETGITQLSGLTAAPGGPTPTPTPTVTPPVTPTPTPTVTPSPTATPTPVGRTTPTPRPRPTPFPRP
jgi:plastocyanin